MKKVFFILPTLGGGGAERVALHLLNNISTDMFDLTVVVIYKNRGDYLKDLREEVKRIFLDKVKIRYSIFSLYKILKRENPDFVVNFSFELMILMGVSIIPFFKNIYFINRQINILSTQNFSKIEKILLKIAYKNFNKIITQSKDMTDDLLKNIDISKEKIMEINNPVNLKEIEKLSKETINLEITKRNKNLLCVGRLSHQKGFDLIIEAISFLKDKTIKLYILGDGEEKNKLLDLIKKLGLSDQVFLLGRKSNPYSYMKNADLFILSSRYEGFPNALLEAGACGLYSICNNCLGGVNEIIEENINGNVINFNDKKLLISVIEKNLLKEKDRKKITERIKDRYSIEIIVKKYEKVLKENK